MNKYLTILIFSLFSVSLFSQVNIGSDTLNSYYAVETVPPTSSNNAITCKAGEDLSDLKRGDKVLLIQITGAEHAPFDVKTNGTVQPGSGSGGKYEFLSVISVNNITKEITFSKNLKNTYTNGEKIQLVKIFEAVEAIVTDPISAPAWDSSSGKGGILALLTLRKLTLSEDINLNGKGFQGADSILYTSGCRASSPTDTMYYIAGSVNKGGIKGEGIKSVTSNYTIGPGNNFNGGGGGIGRFGGGGGGSNYDVGGIGSQQTILCPDIVQVVAGGYGLETGNRGDIIGPSWFYSAVGIKKITFGGGGGGSTYDSNLSLKTTKGGNGGGIVIILTDTLVGDGGSINVNGQSVIEIASAGAGGGGAGGTILLDAATYSNTINISLRGGDGGDSEGANCGGSGGGGSGGVILNSASTLNPLITADFSGGNFGEGCDLSRDGGTGGNGNSIDDYTPVINGFTFNAITGTDTICYGQTPDSIIGTTPKGDPNPAYKWLQSTDNINWSNADGTIDERNYQPPALLDSIYYTREVYFSSNGVRDTSLSVMIKVYPSIENNILTLRDTLCEGAVPGLLSANSVTGGNNSYEYKWESKDNASWVSRGADELLDETDALSQSRHYRRIVTSGPVGTCIDTSVIDTLTVLQAIAGNGFVTNPLDTLICNGQDGGEIIGTATTIGGDDKPHRYSWIRSLDNVNYTDISGTLKDLSVGTLSAGSYYYKRIVHSGEGNACIDTTSLPRKVEVAPDITGNNINTDSSRFCFGDIVNELEPSSILGGGKGGYNFEWRKNDGTGWEVISGENNNNLFPGILYDTSRFYRKVFSGLVAPSVYACVDNSNEITIDVISEIVNNLNLTDQAICQEGQPSGFSPGLASGGAGIGTYGYLWQQNENETTWETAAGVNTNPTYIAPELNVTTEYRRRVTSQICTHYSDTVSVEVYDSIRSNSILGASTQYACFNSPELLNGSQPQGGDGISFNYTWESSSDGNSWTSTGGDEIDYTVPLVTEVKYYRRFVTSGPANECQNTSDSIILYYNNLPTGNIINNTDTLCAGEEITIEYTNLTGNSPWKIELGETAVLHTEEEIEDANGSISFNINETAAIILLSVEDDSSCFADLSTNTDTVKTTVYEVPIANAGRDSADCGLETKLNAVLSTPGSGIWTSDDATFDDATQPEANVTFTEYGIQSLLWTESNWICVDAEYVEITLYEQPLKTDAGEDMLLPYAFDTTLNARPAEFPAEGLWSFTSGEGTFADANLATTAVTLAGVGEYSLLWTIINGVCPSVSDSVHITVEDLKLSNGFSPNGDGINDYYVLQFPTDNSVKVTILDRNGNLVKVITAQYEIKWDGTNESGQPVPEDTYFFIVEEEGVPARNGYIDIRR